MNNFFYAGLTTIFLCFVPLSFAQVTHPHHPDIRLHEPELKEKEIEDDTVIPCSDQIRGSLAAAARELALLDNPGAHEIHLQVIEGLQCESRRNMADIVLTVKIGPNRYRYGKFHIHFGHDGRFIRTTGTNQQIWKETSTSDAWKMDGK